MMSRVYNMTHQRHPVVNGSIEYIVYNHEGVQLSDIHRGMTRNVVLPGIVFLKELDISLRGNTLGLNYSGIDSVEEHDHD
jgi:hypothetical protein